MQVRSEQEALYLACEMEATAIQLYKRAMRLMENQGRAHEPLYARLALMLGDEEEHLRQFRSLYHGLDAAEEQRLTLSAVAEGVLFEGGLMGAVRQGLLGDAESMLRFASQAEETSAAKYREFASLAKDDRARSALLMIAREEEKHLDERRQQNGEL